MCKLNVEAVIMFVGFLAEIIGPCRLNMLSLLQRSPIWSRLGTLGSVITRCELTVYLESGPECLRLVI